MCLAEAHPWTYVTLSPTDPIFSPKNQSRQRGRKEGEGREGGREGRKEDTYMGEGRVSFYTRYMYYTMIFPYYSVI